MNIYADNAATTKMSKAAIAAMTPYLEEYYGNPSSLYSMGQKAKDAIEEARRKIARVIGAEPREITFTSGGSEADNQAILSAAATGKRAGKTHIISDAIEHHAVLNTLKKLEGEGFRVTRLPVGENGILSAEAVEAALDDDTCLVTVMTANNEIGTIQPISQIGALCRKRGVLFHTDAVQAVGHIKVDVAAGYTDMLSASAHKFHGPKGVGFLYARRRAEKSYRGRRSGARKTRGDRKRAGHRRNGRRARRIRRRHGTPRRRAYGEARQTHRGAVGNSPLRAERRRENAASVERQLLFRGRRGRIAAASARRHGHLRFVGIRLHFGIARSEPRPSGDRQTSRRRTRLAAADPR